jgi:hypothetical protein
MKKNASIFVFFVGLLILATFASVAFYFSQPQAVALAESQPTPQPQIQDADDERQPGTEVVRELPALTVNDIKVEVTSVKLTQFNREVYTETGEGTYTYQLTGYALTHGVEIGICYTAPDDGEWRPWVGDLVYDKYVVYPDNITILENEILADGKKPGTRCSLILYVIEDPDRITLPLEFSITRFYAPGRELYSPCQEMQQRLATSPKAQQYGLKISCTDDAEKGPSVSLEEYSKSVSAEEAQKVFDVIATSEVHGEWKFILNDLEK